jgi:hypothetical protein
LWRRTGPHQYALWVRFRSTREAVMGQMRHFLARSPDVWSFARRPSTAALGQSQTARMATAPLRWMCQAAQNGLVSRFRSSHHCVATSFANFGIEGHWQLIDLVPAFRSS